MKYWAIIATMAATTYLLRAGPLLLMRNLQWPSRNRFMRYIPPSIFAALIVPGLFTPEGRLEWGPTLWAGAVGAVAAWHTRSLLLTVATGLVAFVVMNVLWG